LHSDYFFKENPFIFLMGIINDGFVKSRHSRAGGNPYNYNQLKILDSRFQENDEFGVPATFYEIIINDNLVKSQKTTFCSAGKGFPSPAT
jgi:hypothetical protein